jgi:serralysin
MCRICEMNKSEMLDGWSGTFGLGSLNSALARFTTHYQKALDGSFLGTAFPGGGDGVGDGHDITYGLAELPVPILDNVADDISTEHSITVGGDRYISTINTPGDQDFYRIELEAGVTYEFAVYGTKSGLSGIALPDAYVEIYDADGNLIAGTDGGSPNDSLGLDARLTFTAQEDGTYYVNARAFDEAPTNGDNGDLVGDYEVFASVSSYKPYYDVNYETQDDPATERDERGLPTVDSSPLHSLDWGTKFDGTSGNPDGAEGPRPTGNAVETVEGGKNVLYYYFARENEIFVDNAANPLNLTTTMVAKGFSQWEKDAIELGLERYENVADLVYIETDDRFAADIVFVTYNGTPGIATPSLAGRMSPPDTASEGQTEYNAGDYRWTPEGLAPGGVFFGTLIHELGHGHGMSHPHDNGGRSSIMRGVEEIETFVYTTGDFNLNQGVYTMMSYQDGWQESPYGQPRNDLGYGFIGSLMAFDIAVIQDKYGVNEEYATGNDTYVLPDENSAAQFDADGKMTKEGTSWKSIWDAGGTDQIVYNGSKDANIDLRPATLEYEEGGGGWVSYAWGIYGGFTVANSVTIENARSGSGNDTLIGNDVRNVLTSGAGNDTLDGGRGADRMVGGNGDDVYKVDNSRDEVVEAAGQGTDTVEVSSDYSLAANVENLLFTGSASAFLNGNGLDNLIDASAAAQRVTVNGGGGNDEILGGGGGDKLTGGNGNDELVGGGGKDTLIGGAGVDVLDGGAAGDVFMFDQTSVDRSTDVIRGFSGAQGDRVNLNSIDANTGLAGDQAFKFVGSAAFSGTAGELRVFVDASGNQVAAGDVNGDRTADFLIQFTDSAAPIQATDFIF